MEIIIFFKKRRQSDGTEKTRQIGGRGSRKALRFFRCPLTELPPAQGPHVSSASSPLLIEQSKRVYYNR